MYSYLGKPEYPVYYAFNILNWHYSVQLFRIEKILSVYFVFDLFNKGRKRMDERMRDVGVKCECKCAHIDNGTRASNSLSLSLSL